MKVIHKKINHEDSRGTIRDILVSVPTDHCTIIFSKKGAVRGNHYHKKTVQYTYVIEGELLALSRRLGGRKIHKHILKAGDLQTHKPLEIHAMVAKKDCLFLAFAKGVRGGKDYEKDTYRVSPGLESGRR